MKTLQNQTKGLILTIAAWTLFACMGAFVKHAFTYTTAPVAFFCQNFGAFLTLTPYFFLGGMSWMKGGSWGLISARGILGSISFFCLFYSLTKISLTDGALLNNTAPLFVPFFAAILLNTPLRLSISLSAFLGFIGVSLILKPSGGVICLDALPALFSGVASALVMVIMRILKGHDPRKILISYQLIASFGSAPFAIPFLTHLHPSAWVPLIAAGVFFGIGQLLLTKSFKYAEPTVLAPFSYTLVVVSGLLDWAIWGRAPGIASTMGILIVLCGGILTIRYSNQQQTKRV
jgi:drug/metabolite transporter (DMT)-like permease